MRYRVSSRSLTPVDDAGMPDLLNQRSSWIFSRSPVEQISPNKDMNFQYTKLPRPAHAPHLHPCRRPPHLPYLSNQRALCCLAHSPTRLGLVCDFCSSARTFAVRLPPHSPSRDCTCLKLVVIIGGHFLRIRDGSRSDAGLPTGDFHPISSCPCRAYQVGPCDAFGAPDPSVTRKSRIHGRFLKKIIF